MRLGRFQHGEEIFHCSITDTGGKTSICRWPDPFDFADWAASGQYSPPALPTASSPPVLEGSKGTAHVPAIDIERGKLLTPVHRPGKIICIGKNYAEHAAEMGGDVPELPVVFSKFSSVVSGPGAEIELPAISQQVDYEAELVVVVGKPGRRIPRDQALQHVLGYTCGNDISARDWQKGRPGGQWLLGKSFDTFAPVGPWIVTADELANPGNLNIVMRLNGQVMQSANTSQLIYPVDFLVHHLSQFFTLETGDLIFTGTPAGVGAGRTPPVFLSPGDVCEVEIEGIGVLTNPVVAACPDS